MTGKSRKILIVVGEAFNELPATVEVGALGTVGASFLLPEGLTTPRRPHQKPLEIRGSQSGTAGSGYKQIN